MSKDTAMSFARTSISLGSVCLALLSISIPSGLFPIPLWIRVLLSFGGVILFLSAALTIDWAIDLFSDEDWLELDKKVVSLGEKAFHPEHSFRARMRLFGGGYLLLSVGIGFIVFAILFLLIIGLDLSPTWLEFVSIVTSGLCGFFVFIKMMTRKLGTVAKTVILLGFLAAVSFGLNIYLLLPWIAAP